MGEDFKNLPPDPLKQLKRVYHGGGFEELKQAYGGEEKLLTQIYKGGIMSSSSRRRSRKATEIKDIVEAEEKANTSTLGVIADEISSEAVTRTRQYLDVGKAVAHAVWNYLSKKGMSIEDAVKVDVPSLVIRAIDKLADYERLEEYVRWLENELEYYRSRTSPLVRLEYGLRLMMDFLKMCAVLKALGFDVKRSPFVRFYAWLITRYIFGVPPVYSGVKK